MTTASRVSTTAELITYLNECVVGTHVTSVRLLDYTWFFTFDDDWEVATECYWRLISQDGLSVSSDDHQQLFGLREPVDASARSLAALTEAVTSLEIIEPVTDLWVHFGEDRVEFLNTSCGYEGWRVQLKKSPTELSLIALGGGGLARW